SANKGETQMLPGAGGAKRILLVGCGEMKKFDRKAAREFTQLVCKVLGSTPATDAMLHLAALGLKQDEASWLLGYLARHLTAASYRYTRTVSKPKPAMRLSRFVVNTAGSLPTRAAKAALAEGKAIGLGVNEARNLADLPGNICTPSFLASNARKLSRSHAKLSVSILEEKKMRELGMGALLSVSAGSHQAAKLIVMNYKGGKSSQKPHVFGRQGHHF
ncbi:unnamed protein product, partial [marine sediment metagenome]